MRTLLFFCIFLFSLPSFARTEQDVIDNLDQLFGQHEPYIEFYKKLSKSILSGDCNSLAKLNLYPLNTISDIGSSVIESEKQFLKQCNVALNEVVISAVRDQTLESLNMSSNGISFHLGEIWFGGICLNEECTSVEVKVFTYNRKSSMLKKGV